MAAQQEFQLDALLDVPADVECEPGLALASLGFPLVLITLLGHGLGIFLVRHGIWLPGSTADLAWSTLLIGGVLGGLGLSAVGVRRI